jgi:predicted transposase YbfD/YdcC
MGLTVYADRTLPNGLAISGFYVNIDDIVVKKDLHSEEVRYNVSADYNCYASKQARLDNKDILQKYKIYISTTTIDNIQAQVYEEVKKLFDTTEDDL